MTEQPWRAIAARKQHDRDSRIPAAWRLTSLPSTATLDLAADNVLDVPRRCGLLTPDELAVTENYDATDLVAEIAKGKLRSEDVVLAFCMGPDVVALAGSSQPMAQIFAQSLGSTGALVLWAFVILLQYVPRPHRADTVPTRSPASAS